MTKATPEQIRVFRHRRWVVVLGSIGILLLGFLLMVGLLSLDAVNTDGRVAIVVGFSTVLLTGIVGNVFWFTCFRCPICNHPIPAGYAPGAGWVLGSSCKRCDVDFAA